MVNLFIGLIVDAIFTIKGEQKEEKSKELQEIELLKEQVQELKQILLKKSENDNT